jgi:dynein heavy chain 2
LDETVPTQPGDTLPSWVPSHLSANYDKFSAIFKKLVSEACIDTDMKWKKWFGIQECESNFPQGISEFQKVIITKLFREDRVESSLVNFVEKVMGSIEVLGPKLELEEVFAKESSAGTPILFITSPGSDPSSQLEEFAIKKIGRENFVQMSLGGNQNEAAMKMLKSGAESGQWVFLKNLHLVPAFLQLLEKEFSGLVKHKNFRLWLTTEFQDKFPAILLETCYKLSYESPPGVKKNIERAYSLVDPTFLASSALNNQLVFVLSYFHSVIQERRNYIPQGWSKYYEFSYADFVAALKLFDSLGVKSMNKSTLKT